MATGSAGKPRQQTDQSVTTAGNAQPGDRMSPGPDTAAAVAAADITKIYPPWIVVFLAAWLGTVAGGVLFGFACGLMPFWFLGPMATITGLYGAFMGLLLTTIGSLPISLILTGIVRLLPSHRRTRENYIMAAVSTGFCTGVGCFSALWQLSPLALIPGFLGATGAGLATLLSARNELIAPPAPPPVSTWGDLDA